MSLRQRLRDQLTAAMRARDASAVSVLRATLAAIDNAEAVPQTDEHPRATAIEHSPRGLAAADLPRRVLREADVQAIVRCEMAEREEAAAAYSRAGEQLRADRLLEEAEILRRAAGPEPTGGGS